MKKKELEEIKQQIEQLEQENGELTQDLKRTRADFENYRKNVEIERERAQSMAKKKMVLDLLPVLDDLNLALGHVPEDLKDNKWTQGIINLDKKLINSLEKIKITKINSQPGTEFNPELHDAITMEDEGGDQELISQELRAGYQYDGEVIRPAMVKVKQ